MFYHVQIHHKYNVDQCTCDLSYDELKKKFVTPYEQGMSIFINGKSIRGDLIHQIKIFETNDSLEGYVEAIENRWKLYPNERAVMTPAAWTAMEQAGRDVTDKVIGGPFGHLRSNIPTKTMTLTDDEKRDKVFVVHGRDSALKDEVCAFLSEIGLKPIVLHRKVDAGLTIIEKFEKNANVAVILLTPDDYGFIASELEKPPVDRSGQLRARQNVIFELGYFIGKLGRSSVCCINKGVEIPSDINGVVYKSVTSSISEVGFELVKELKEAGLQPDY